MPCLAHRPCPGDAKDWLRPDRETTWTESVQTHGVCCDCAGRGDHHRATSVGSAGLANPCPLVDPLGYAVTRLPGHLDVFWIGPDGAIGSTAWDATTGWAPAPFPITPPGATRTDSPLVADSRVPDHLDVFWIGPDGAIGSTAWDATTGWAPAPFPITPPGATRADSPLVAVARVPDHLDVFWVDGAIGTTYWDAAPGQGWADHQPFPITPPGATRTGSPLTAVTRLPGHLDVFWIGPDGAIGSTAWDATTGWAPAPFPITPPGATGT